jgi:hypothetical protein
MTTLNVNISSKMVIMVCLSNKPKNFGSQLSLTDALGHLAM